MLSWLFHCRWVFHLPSCLTMALNRDLSFLPSCYSSRSGCYMENKHFHKKNPLYFLFQSLRNSPPVAWEMQKRLCCVLCSVQCSDPWCPVLHPLAGHHFITSIRVEEDGSVRRRLDSCNTKLSAPLNLLVLPGNDIFCGVVTLHHTTVTAGFCQRGQAKDGGKRKVGGFAPSPPELGATLLPSAAAFGFLQVHRASQQDKLRFHTAPTWPRQCRLLPAVPGIRVHPATPAEGTKLPLPEAPIIADAQPQIGESLLSCLNWILPGEMSTPF